MSVRHLPLALATLLACHIAVRAQEPAAADLPVFRLSVALVQIDAVVTDRRGRHVTTLGPDDFDVRQDGRPQRVVAATYVRADEAWHDTSGLPPIPPDPRTPRDAARTIALVVDDLRMSFESVYHTRRALQRFVDRQLLPDDYVALVTTSAARGTSVPFTYSRPQLRAAVTSLRFSLTGLSPASLLDPVRGDGWPFSDPFELFRERTTAEAVLRRIEEIAVQLPSDGGRKVIVLVSEGFSVFGQAWNLDTVNSAMRRLVDRANRAGVVIYAVDPRGLVNTGPSAADNVRSPAAALAAAGRRRDALLETQDGLRYLAAGTGGFAVVNSNDIERALHRIVADQAGYYLIGYEPEEHTFGPDSDRAFRRVKVRLTRKGLTIRTRTGFYARPTE